MDSDLLPHLTAAAEGVVKACASYEEAYSRCMTLRQKAVSETQSLISLKRHCGDELKPHFDAIEAAIAADDVTSRRAVAEMETLRDDLARQRGIAQDGMRMFLSSYRHISTVLDMDKQLDGGDAGGPKAYRDNNEYEAFVASDAEAPDMPGCFRVLNGAEIPTPADELTSSVNKACKEKLPASCVTPKE